MRRFSEAEIEALEIVLFDENWNTILKVINDLAAQIEKKTILLPTNCDTIDLVRCKARGEGARQLSEDIKALKRAYKESKRRNKVAR